MGTSRIILAVVVGITGLGAFADQARRRDAVVEVVQRVSPAVVYIGTEHKVESRFRGNYGLLEEFFGSHERPAETVQALGSGVIVDAGGLIVTNEHVIRGASAIHVVLADGRRLNAEVIGSDGDNDLAVLKVNAGGELPMAPLGNSADLMIGETTIAIGSPFGLSKTVTRGVVSAVGRSFKADGKTYNDFVQTDASINPGNSGGPLLNIDGQIIGINTAIFASAQGIGFAIPADKVRRIVGELTQFGKVRPSWVGVEVDPLLPKAARALGWDRTHGVLVSGVEAASPAEGAGLASGDIISEIGGSRVTDTEDFLVRLKGYPAGSELRLTVFRQGKLRELTLRAVEFPAELAEGLAWGRLGVRVKPLRGGGGLMITAVRSGSQAGEIGLAPGDVIRRLNNRVVETMDGFREALISARRAHSVLILLQRGRTAYHLTLPI